MRDALPIHGRTCQGRRRSEPERKKVIIFVRIIVNFKSTYIYPVMRLDVLLPLVLDPAVERVLVVVLGLAVRELVAVLRGDSEVEELAEIFVDGEGGIPVANDSCLFIDSSILDGPHAKNYFELF